MYHPAVMKRLYLSGPGTSACRALTLESQLNQKLWTPKELLAGSAVRVHAHHDLPCCPSTLLVVNRNGGIHPDSSPRIVLGTSCVTTKVFWLFTRRSSHDTQSSSTSCRCIRRQEAAHRSTAYDALANPP